MMLIMIVMSYIIMLLVLTMNFKGEGLVCRRGHTIVSNTVVGSHVTTIDACDVQCMS